MKIKRLIPTALTLAFIFFAGCDGTKIYEYRGPEDSQIPFSTTGTHTSSITSWKVGDQIGVYTSDGQGTGGANTNSVFAIKDGDLENSGKADFSGDLSIGTPTGPNRLYAYYPYSSFTATTSYDAVPLTLPAAQTMTGATHDGNYGFMYAGTDLSATSSGSSLSFSAGDLEFKSLTGVLNFTVTGLDPASPAAAMVSAGDPVDNVSITASGSTVLTGAFALDLSTGVMDFGSAGSNRVTVNCPAGMTLGSLSARAVVNPFRMSGAEESLQIRITIGQTILSRTIAAESAIEVAAGSVTEIEAYIDNTWDVEGYVPGKVEEFYLVTANVGPHTLCCGWEEPSEVTTSNYVVQLFTDRTGSPVYTSPSVTCSTHAMYSGTATGKGPFRFTFTELEPATTYYMRVKNLANGDETYSDFLEGTTEPLHSPVAGEVFHSGFDKIFWGSDALNSAGSVQPAYSGTATPNPAGWENLTNVLLPQTNPGATLNALGAFVNDNDDYGLKGWRSTGTLVYPSPGYLKLGSGSVAGSIITPAMGDALPAAGAECILTFKACPFVITGQGFINVFVVHDDTQPSTSTTVPANTTNILTYAGNSGLNTHDTAANIYIGEDYRAADYRWIERSFTIPALKPTDKLWFVAIGGTSFRFLLDDIHVVM